MPTNVNSVPSTFSLLTGIATQALTFAIPAGFVCVSAFLTINGTLVSGVGTNELQITWAVSTEVDPQITPTTTGANVINIGPGGISDINGAAGGNATGTVAWNAFVSGATFSCTSCVLTLTNYQQTIEVMSQLSADMIPLQQPARMVAT